MLNCKLCDYYKPLSGNDTLNTNVSWCEFLDILLFDDFEKRETEYPCSKISYQDYLNKTL